MFRTLREHKKTRLFAVYIVVPECYKRNPLLAKVSSFQSRTQLNRLLLSAPLLSRKLEVSKTIQATTDVIKDCVGGTH